MLHLKAREFIGSPFSIFSKTVCKSFWPTPVISRTCRAERRRERLRMDRSIASPWSDSRQFHSPERPKRASQSYPIPPKLIQQKASEINRIQKFLEDANIKLASVVSDINGMSARQMLQRIIVDDMTAPEMANLAREGSAQRSPIWNSPWKVI